MAVFGTTERYNGISHEIQVRRIFEPHMNWTMLFVRASGLFTPDVIREADLLMVCRGPHPDPIDLSAPQSGISDTMTPGAPFWTDTNVRVITNAVETRGIGLLALQSTVLCGHFEFMKFLDVTGVAPHLPEPMWYTRMNTSHPITKGVGKFAVLLDEQPVVVITSKSTATLFESTAVHEKRQGVSGWALERGTGRIVGLLPGSTMHAYQTPEYQNILWRAAHWAMNRAIPPYPNAENRYYL
ncbi:hypothetical protein ACFL1R_08375 [Candidatus Latescibacterota bacterium]